MVVEQNLADRLGRMDCMRLGTLLEEMVKGCVYEQGRDRQGPQQGISGSSESMYKSVIRRARFLRANEEYEFGRVGWLEMRRGGVPHQNRNRVVGKNRTLRLQTKWHGRAALSVNPCDVAPMAYIIAVNYPSYWQFVGSMPKESTILYLTSLSVSEVSTHQS
jgi:hypothetical protein